jgi:hypothetical protein
MVSTKKLVYDFKRKHNSPNSSKNVDVPLVEIIAYLNEAQLVWLRNMVKLAQVNSELRDYLRFWKEDYVSLVLTKNNNVYNAKYPDNIYRRLNQIAVCSKKECCEKTKEIIPRIIQSDDLHDARKNTYRKSDFYYEQLLAVESKDGLIIYTDNELELEEFLIDYYRLPNQLHCPTSEYCSNGEYYDYQGVVITKDTNFEGDEISGNDIVDIALLYVTTDTRNTEAFNQRVNLIIQSNNLYKLKV